MGSRAEIVGDSQENSPMRYGEGGPAAQSDGESSEPKIGSTDMEQIFQSWYIVDVDFKFDFPEEFQRVPAEFLHNKLWRRPMSSKEVIDRLLGNKSNEPEGDHLIQPIMVYFQEVVSSATELFADHQKRYSRNKHHLEVLLRAKDSKRVPRFLQLETPEINSTFSPDEAATLKTDFRQVLDKASEELLALTIKARETIDAELRREAAKIVEDVRQSAMNRWIEAQISDDCTFNRWDNIFPVMFYNGARDADPPAFLIPLSAVIFRTAMKECQSKVSLALETELQRKTEEHALRRREMDKRRQAQSEASALPPREAEKSLEKRLKEIIAPYVAEVRTLKAGLQKNEGALRRADPPRAHERSAQENRKREQSISNDAPGSARAKGDPPGGRPKHPCGRPAARNDHSSTAQPTSVSAAPANASESGSEDGQRERRRRKRKRGNRKAAQH